MDYQSIATFIMEMAGTVAFAASGAMVGVERNMDIFGVSVLGVATAVGGGMIRDIVLGVIPPAVFRNPVYALVSVLASCIVFFIFYFKRELLEGHRRETYDKFMLVLDSVGLGIFTVVGVNAGIRQGHMDNAFLLVFLGEGLLYNSFFSLSIKLLRKQSRVSFATIYFSIPVLFSTTAATSSVTTSLLSI